MTKLNKIADTNKVPRISLILLTPDMAKNLLANRAVNRAISDGAVDKLQRAIVEGRWKTTHQGISIDHLGRLTDGQHRCKAVERSGVSVFVYLSEYPEGADPMDAVDIGVKKSAGHILEIRGVVPPGKGRRFESLARALGVGLTGKVMNMDENHVSATVSAYRDEFEWCASLKQKTLIAPHCAALAYAYPVNREMVSEAAEKIINNDNLAHMSPLWLLHETISRDKSAAHGYRSYYDMFIRTLRALQAYVENENIKMLKGAICDEKGNPMGTPATITYWRNMRTKAGLVSGLPWVQGV